MISKTDIKLSIIRKLILWRKWNNSHTENILNGLPKHIRGLKITKDAIEELIKDDGC